MVPCLLSDDTTSFPARLTTDLTWFFGAHRESLSKFKGETDQDPRGCGDLGPSSRLLTPPVVAISRLWLEPKGRPGCRRARDLRPPVRPLSSETVLVVRRRERGGGRRRVLVPVSTVLNVPPPSGPSMNLEPPHRPGPDRYVPPDVETVSRRRPPRVEDTRHHV